MTLDFEKEYEYSFPFDEEELAMTVICGVLDQEDCPYECEISLVLCGEEEIRETNRNFREIDRVTDVLSFPSLDGIKGEILRREKCNTELDGRYIFIGSIVLCDDKIRAQAEEKARTISCA